MRSIDKTLYRRGIAWMLRRARQMRGFSRRYIASQIGISVYRYWQLELGLLDLSASEWWVFCQIVEIECDSISIKYLWWKGKMGDFELSYREQLAARTEMPEFYFSGMTKEQRIAEDRRLIRLRSRLLAKAHLGSDYDQVVWKG